MSTQDHNQEFFRAEEFSWNKGTSINNHLQHEKERLIREKSPFFPLETLKKLHFKWKISPIDDHNLDVFFPKLEYFFPISKKGQGRPLLLFPSLVTRLPLHGLLTVRSTWKMEIWVLLINTKNYINKGS